MDYEIRSRNGCLCGIMDFFQFGSVLMVDVVVSISRGFFVTHEFVATVCLKSWLCCLTVCVCVMLLLLCVALFGSGTCKCYVDSYVMSNNRNCR